MARFIAGAASGHDPVYRGVVRAFRDGFRLLGLRFSRHGWGAQRTFTTDMHHSLRRGKAISAHLGEPIFAVPDDSPAAIDAELEAAADARKAARRTRSALPLPPRGTELPGRPLRPFLSPGHDSPISAARQQ